MTPRRVIAGKRETGLDIRYTLDVNASSDSMEVVREIEESTLTQKFLELSSYKELPKIRSGMNVSRAG